LLPGFAVVPVPYEVGFHQLKTSLALASVENKPPSIKSSCHRGKVSSSDTYHYMAKPKKLNKRLSKTLNRHRKYLQQEAAANQAVARLLASHTEIPVELQEQLLKCAFTIFHEFHNLEHTMRMMEHLITGISYGCRLVEKAKTPKARKEGEWLTDKERDELMKQIETSFSGSL
jgi:hypothetical protein